MNTAMTPFRKKSQNFLFLRILILREFSLTAVLTGRFSARFLSVSQTVS